MMCFSVSLLSGDETRAAKGVPSPDSIVLEEGKSFDFVKVPLTQAADLYRMFTGSKVRVAPLDEDEIYFSHHGPLKNSEAAYLLSLGLKMRGWEIVPDPEIRGNMVMRRCDRQKATTAQLAEAQKVPSGILGDPAEVLLTADQTTNRASWKPVDLAALYTRYTGQRILFSALPEGIRFGFFQTGPLTRGELVKLLWNAMQIEGCGIATDPGMEGVVHLVVVDHGKLNARIAEWKKREKGRRPRVRYVPRPK